MKKEGVCGKQRPAPAKDLLGRKMLKGISSSYSDEKNEETKDVDNTYED
jgi:hypothetical protein